MTYILDILSLVFLGACAVAGIAWIRWEMSKKDGDE